LPSSAWCVVFMRRCRTSVQVSGRRVCLVGLLASCVVWGSVSAETVRMHVVQSLHSTDETGGALELEQASSSASQTPSNAAATVNTEAGNLVEAAEAETETVAILAAADAATQAAENEVNQIGTTATPAHAPAVAPATPVFDPQCPLGFTDTTPGAASMPKRPVQQLPTTHADFAGFTDKTYEDRRNFTRSYVDSTNSTNDGSILFRVKECTCDDQAMLCDVPTEPGKKTALIADFQAVQQANKLACAGALTVMSGVFMEYTLDRKATVQRLTQNVVAALDLRADTDVATGLLGEKEQGTCSASEATTESPEYAQSQASSVWSDDAMGHSHGKGRLDSAQAWSAKSNEVGQWWQMDVGSTRQIGGVVTQGRTQDSQYVKSYKVEVSSDGSTWADVDGGATFTANSAATDEKVEHMFSSPVSGRYVRIVVQSWNSHISMRAGVLFCAGGLSNTSAPPRLEANWTCSGHDVFSTIPKLSDGTSAMINPTDRWAKTLHGLLEASVSSNTISTLGAGIPTWPNTKGYCGSGTENMCGVFINPPRFVAATPAPDHAIPELRKDCGPLRTFRHCADFKEFWNCTLSNCAHLNCCDDVNACKGKPPCTQATCGPTHSILWDDDARQDGCEDAVVPDGAHLLRIEPCRKQGDERGALFCAIIKVCKGGSGPALVQGWGDIFSPSDASAIQKMQEKRVLGESFGGKGRRTGIGMEIGRNAFEKKQDKEAIDAANRATQKAAKVKEEADGMIREAVAKLRFLIAQEALHGQLRL